MLGIKALLGNGDGGPVARQPLQTAPSRLTGPYVFLSATGETPLDAKNFYHRMFQPTLRLAGIENFRWHDLRHTFASRLVMRGPTCEARRELMGHMRLTMTLRYARLSTEHRLAAVRLLDAPAGGRTGTKPAPASTPTDSPPHALRSKSSSCRRNHTMSRPGIEPGTRCLKGSCSTD